MNKKIYIFIGHPNTDDTLCTALADAYEQGARQAGHEVRRAHLGGLTFDPILHKGYREIQELEADLKQVQEDIRWADHIVIIYPIWWTGMPALMKGMFDRIFLPMFAFSFEKGKKYIWKKLLRGKSARVVTTTDAAPFIGRFLFGDSSNGLRRGILGFSGIAPVRLTQVWNVRYITPAKVERWKKKVHKLGQKGR